MTPIFIWSFLFAPALSFSQTSDFIFECGHENPEEISEESPFYLGDEESCYDPTNPCNHANFPYSAIWSEVDTIIVRLNFHFIRTGDVGLNFDENDGNCPSCIDNSNMTMYRVADDFVNWLNNESSGMDDYIVKLDENGDTLPEYEPYLDKEGHPVPNLGDSKIRYELYEEGGQGAVHYHHVESDYKWLVSYKDIPECLSEQSVMGSVTLKNQFGLYDDRVLDVFIFDEWYENEVVQDTVNCRVARGVASIGGSTLSIGNLWHIWQDNQGDWTLWDALGLLKHEIGHCLTLGHTFPSGSCCDATEPNYFNFSNNTMGYNTNGQVVFSPCQMDKIFNFLYKTTPEWAVLDNNQNLNPPPGESLNPEIIIDDPNGVTWDEDTEIYKHIRIKSGSRLNIEDASIGLAPDVKIHVEVGAMLYVENSLLTTVCSPPVLRWNGIIVEGNPDRDHPENWYDSFDPDGLDAGRVVLLGSTVRMAKVGIRAFDLEFSTSPFQFFLTSSGYVYSDQSNFLSCDIGILFSTYDRPNNSKLLNTTFKPVSISLSGFKPEAGILLNSNYGLEMQRCTFENIKEMGIYAMDSGFEAFNGCSFSNIDGEAISALSSTGFVPSQLNIEIGKEATSYKNQFSRNLLDIRVEGYSNLLNRIKIVNNVFSDNWNSNNPGANQSKGIEVLRAPVDIEINQFLDKFNSLSFVPYVNYRTLINSNHFINFNTGIWYEPGGTHLSEFYCNKFLQNHRSGVFVDASIINNQGNATVGYGNEWERGENYSPSAQIADIRTGTSLSKFGFSGGIFDYFVEEEIPLIHPYRPLCNLTHSPSGCNILTPFDYEVPDAGGTIDICEPINPFLEHEPKSIPQLRTEMIQIAQLDSFYTYNLEYTKRAAVKYQKVITKVDSLLQLDQLSLADNMLSQEPESDYFYLRVGLLIHKEEYSNAQTLLNTETPATGDEEDYRDVQLINIDRLTDHEFELDSTKRVTLEVIAEKRSTPSTFARSILSLIDKRSWVPVFPEDTTYTEQARIIPDREVEVVTKIFPNPSKGIFKVVPGSSFEREDELEFRIYNVMGVQLLYGTIPPYTEFFEIDLQKKTNGTYILTLHNARHQESFIIQKH